MTRPLRQRHQPNTAVREPPYRSVFELTQEEQQVANSLQTRTIVLPFETTPFPQVVDYLTAARTPNRNE